METAKESETSMDGAWIGDLKHSDIHVWKEPEITHNDWIGKKILKIKEMIICMEMLYFLFVVFCLYVCLEGLYEIPPVNKANFLIWIQIVSISAIWTKIDLPLNYWFVPHWIVICHYNSSYSVQ